MANTNVTYSEKYYKGTLMVVAHYGGRSLQMPIFDEEIGKKSIDLLKEEARSKLLRSIRNMEHEPHT